MNINIKVLIASSLEYQRILEYFHAQNYDENAPNYVAPTWSRHIKNLWKDHLL